MDEFGGEDQETYKRRLIGWARYILTVERDVGYPYCGPLMNWFRRYIAAQGGSI